MYQLTLDHNDHKTATLSQKDISDLLMGKAVKFKFVGKSDYIQFDEKTKCSMIPGVGLIFVTMFCNEEYLARIDVHLTNITLQSHDQPKKLVRLVF